MTTNIQLALRVAKHVELVLVTLRSADIKTDIDPFGMPPVLNLVQGYRCRYDISEHADYGRIKIFVDLNFAAKRSESEDGDDAVNIEATFLLVYAIDPAISLESECLEHFADANGPYNVWPYWRELVQTAASRVGLGGVTVPVFRPMTYEVDDIPCVSES